MGDLTEWVQQQFELDTLGSGFLLMAAHERRPLVAGGASTLFDRSTWHDRRTLGMRRVFREVAIGQKSLCSAFTSFRSIRRNELEYPVSFVTEAQNDHPVHTNKILVQRYYNEMWNTWNFALADELLSAEISFRGSLGVEVHGRSAFCKYMQQVRNAFPDFHNQIEQLVAEGDHVVARLKYTGTQRGEIFGVPPSGKSISYAGVAFFRIAGNRVVEGWVLGDLVSLTQQLGAQTVPRALK